MPSTLRATAIGAVAALAIALTGAASAAEFHGGRSQSGGHEWHGDHWRGAPVGGWHSGWRGYGRGGPFAWGYDPHYNDPNYTGYDDVNSCTRFRPVYNRYGKFIGRRAVDICS